MTDDSSPREPSPAKPDTPAPTSSTSSTSSTPKDAQWERDTLERLMFATLKEQRQSRLWRNAIRLAWLSFFVVMASLIFESDGPIPMHADKTMPHTAVIEIRGEIGPGQEASSEFLVTSLRAAFEDSGSQGVVLLINSPGGSPVHAGIINDEIRRLREKHKKPVYAVVEDSCASAAYYIAAAADRIFVDKASIVGSIGVLMDGFGFVGLMDKLGVERRLMTAGENKGFLDPFSPQTPQQKAFAQSMLNQVHSQFIEVVKAGRGTRLKETPELFSGLFWTGQQAIELGLADQLGSVDFVAREVIKAEDLVDYTRRDNVAERLAKKFGAAIGDGAVRAVQSGVHLR